jgi:hypothetical protein
VRAASKVTPGASRATTLSHRTARTCGTSLSPSTERGRKTCTSLLGKAKARGMMPMIVNGCPSSCTVLPTTFGSAPRRVRQRASLTTATRLEPGTSSAVPKARPRAAETPRVVKKRPSTMAAVRFTGSPTPDMLRVLTPGMKK